MITKQRRWISCLALVVAISVCVGTEASLAQSYDPDQGVPKPTLLEKRLEKLGRGLSNILFGWAEIPLTFDRKMKEGKGLAYLIGAVPVIGTAKAFIRTGTGVVEVFTFGKTKPDVNYEAILEPEYIF